MSPISKAKNTSRATDDSPFTVSHNVGIVAKYSYIVIVNPYTFPWSSMYKNGSDSTSQWKCTSGLSTCYIVSEGASWRASREIGEKDALDTPVPPEILHERVAEEELCKGECVRVNDRSRGNVKKKRTPELNRHMLRYLTSRKSGHQDDYCGYVEDGNSRDAA